MSSTGTLHRPDAAAPASSGAALWHAVVEAAIEVFRTHAVHTVSLDDVAAAANVDRTLLDEQFPTMDDVFVSVIQVWKAARIEPLMPVAQSDGAVAFLRAIVVANIADPALMRTLTSCANIAATPDHPMASLLQRQWLQFHAHLQRTLMHDIAIGREPDVDAARSTEQLIAMYEGLQLQSMVRPHMDLLEAFDRGIAALRSGWSPAAPAPTWDI